MINNMKEQFEQLSKLLDNHIESLKTIREKLEKHCRELDELELEIKKLKTK